MVLIQETEEKEQNVNPSETATAKSSITTNADADGLETASGAYHGGASNNGGEARKEQPPQRSSQGQEQGQGIPWRSESSEGALEKEELEQKALAQANEAKLEGNKLFGEAQYEEALSRYELALQVASGMPSSMEIRSICHANRAVCFMKLGKYESTIKECTKALELNPVYVKALIRRGEAHEKLENFEQAIADMKKILEIDPSNDQARKNIYRLEPLAAEKMEKMKEEMIAKLKEVGNSLLGRFGMSVDNFKAVKDPETGSYSVSFQN